MKMGYKKQGFFPLFLTFVKNIKTLLKIELIKAHLRSFRLFSAHLQADSFEFI